jgi:hypothetical protein
MAAMIWISPAPQFGQWCMSMSKAKLQLSSRWVCCALTPRIALMHGRMGLVRPGDRQQAPSGGRERCPPARPDMSLRRRNRGVRCRGRFCAPGFALWTWRSR